MAIDVSNKTRRFGRLIVAVVCATIGGYLFHSDELLPFVLSIGFVLGAFALIERDFSS
jgi:uncharacterized membrane protein YccC